MFSSYEAEHGRVRQHRVCGGGEIMRIKEMMICFLRKIYDFVDLR